MDMCLYELVIVQKSFNLNAKKKQSERYNSLICIRFFNCLD